MTQKTTEEYAKEMNASYFTRAQNEKQSVMRCVPIERATLTGTEKQVVYANKCREQVLLELAKSCEGEDAKQIEPFFTWIMKKTDASFWIEKKAWVNSDIVHLYEKECV